MPHQNGVSKPVGVAPGGSSAGVVVRGEGPILATGWRLKACPGCGGDLWREGRIADCGCHGLLRAALDKGRVALLAQVAALLA
jgi:hypothetical protein